MEANPKIIVICGPTASGKSALAVELALRCGGEVISADSRQVYRGLNIGTAKITTEEMKGVPHHLLDIAEPNHRVSVAEYKTLGDTAIAEILSRGKMPIICGGTGYYIDALVDDARPAPVEPNPVLRAELEQKSAEELFAMLREKDPKRAETIDAKNKRRLVRALEIVDAIGAVPPIVRDEKYDALWIGLEIPKEVHQEKIAERTEKRMTGGMIEEAKKIHTEGLSYERMRELGLEYGCLADLLEEKITQAECAERITKETWQYVRRQYTWFRRNTNIHWFSNNDTEDILKLTRTFLD